MKNIILFTFISCCLGIKAQIIFPAPGADWHYETVNGFGGVGPVTYSNNEIKYLKDTVILGQSAALLGDVYNFDMPYPYEENLHSKTYVYTSNDTVYFCNKATSNQWQILYNFNCQAGDSWEIYIEDSTMYSNPSFTFTTDYFIVNVDSVKYTLINGDSLKTLYVTYEEYFNNYSSSSNRSAIIYDKIGDINYMFNFIPRELETCDGCPIFGGLLCYQDSTFALYRPDTTKDCNYHASGIAQILGNNYQFKVYPNPASTALQLSVNNEQLPEVKIFDVLGNEVMQSKQKQIDVSNLPNGVYFVRMGNSAQKFVVQH